MIDKKRLALARKYAAKLSCEQVTDLSDHSIETALTNCVRPPSRDMYPLIRQVFAGCYTDPEEHHDRR